jgi:polyisoprenoid-binding protein YceI
MRAIGYGLVALTLATRALAEPRPYRVVQLDGSTGLVVKVPYTFGTHTQSVSAVQGELQIDRQTLEVAGGRLEVPIAAIRSDSAERDCHLRESLGIDYSRSRFPAEHVCDDRNQLPPSGGDAVAFPAVGLEVKGGKALGDPKLLEQGQEVRVLVEGSWNVHGVTRPARLELTVSADPAPGSLRVRGRQAFAPRDYGVVVKSAHLLFVAISVADEVTALLDVRLAPAEAR